jgi:hypothetical protein
MKNLANIYVLDLGEPMNQGSVPLAVQDVLTIKAAMGSIYNKEMNLEGLRN